VHDLGGDQIEVHAELGHRRRSGERATLAFEARTAQHEVPAGAEGTAWCSNRERFVRGGRHQEGDIDSALEE
jgi:hypothetical protein